MCSVSQLQGSFHFPGYANWKLESHILQRLTRLAFAVSGLLSFEGWKQGFYLLQYIENIEFPVSGLSTPTGAVNRNRTGPQGPEPLHHNRRC